MKGEDTKEMSKKKSPVSPPRSSREVYTLSLKVIFTLSSKPVVVQKSVEKISEGSTTTVDGSRRPPGQRSPRSPHVVLVQSQSYTHGGPL